MERAITATLGFNDQFSYWITKAAGVGEVAFGVFLFFAYRNVSLLIVNIIALIGLLAYVTFFIPAYLIEAFNPVTTNIPLIVITLVLIASANKMGSESSSNHM